MGGDSSAQPLDIYLVPSGCPDQGSLPGSSVDLSHRHQHQPLPLHGCEPRCGPQLKHGLGFRHGLRWWGCLLTTGYSLPHLVQFSLFIGFKLFHCFSFCPIYLPHTCTLEWLPLRAGHTAGGLQDDLWPGHMAQACMAPGQPLVVSPPPGLCWVVAGGPLCVYSQTMLF